MCSRRKGRGLTAERERERGCNVRDVWWQAEVLREGGHPEREERGGK